MRHRLLITLFAGLVMFSATVLEQTATTINFKVPDKMKAAAGR